jgi:hypothetical protein
VVAGGFTKDGDWEPWPPPNPARLVAPLQAGIELAGKALELGGMLGTPGAGAVGKLLGQVAGTSKAAWAMLSKHAEGKQPLPGRGGPEAVRAMLRVAAGPQLVTGWQPVVCILDDLDRAPTAQAWWHGLLLRLAGAVLVEAHDEWQVSDRRYLSEGSMALLTATANEVAPAQLLPA